MNNLKKSEISRIIEMAWEDRTPFEAIQNQFSLDEKDVIKLMRKELEPSGFKMWRKRVTGRKTKHKNLRDNFEMRFSSPKTY